MRVAVCHRALASLVVIVALALMSCDTTSVQDRALPLEGEVLLLLPDLQRIVVQHEAIEGWSAAANMEYPVADSDAIAQLMIGDRIRGVLLIQGMRYQLTEIEVIAAREQ